MKSIVLACVCLHNLIRKSEITPQGSVPNQSGRYHETESRSENENTMPGLNAVGR
jgi:phage-related protein